jgi:hypothetical protein
MFLLATRYDASGVGQGVLVGSDFSTAVVLPRQEQVSTAVILPQQEQENARLDQYFQRNPRPVTRVVKKSKLIQQFDIAFKRNEIQWPGRRNRQERVQI